MVPYVSAGVAVFVFIILVVFFVYKCIINLKDNWGPVDITWVATLDDYGVNTLSQKTRIQESFSF